MSHFKPVDLAHASRLINHGPTVLVTSRHGERRNIMAAAWSMPVEFAPPRIAVVVDKHTFTRELMQASGTFGLCIPGAATMKTEQVAQLEAWAEEFNASLTPLKEFILPGGTLAAAHAHLARTICRRAERAVVALEQHEAVRAAPRRYLNRLSDLMFVLSRVLNRHRPDGSVGDDVYWKSERLANAEE